MQPGYPDQDPHAQQQHGQPTPGQPYGQPAGGAPGQGQQNNLGLIGMILGIVALPLSLCCAVLGLLLGIAATVLGNMARKKADEGLATNRGQAKAALICGIIAIVIAAINIVLGIILDVNYGYRFPGIE